MVGFGSISEKHFISISKLESTNLFIGDGECDSVWRVKTVNLKSAKEHSGLTYHTRIQFLLEENLSYHKC